MVWGGEGTANPKREKREKNNQRHLHHHAGYMGKNRSDNIDTDHERLAHTPCKEIACCS